MRRILNGMNLSLKQLNTKNKMGINKNNKMDNKNREKKNDYK